MFTSSFIATSPLKLAPNNQQAILGIENLTIPFSSENTPFYVIDNTPKQQAYLHRNIFDC